MSDILFPQNPNNLFPENQTNQSSPSAPSDTTIPTAPGTPSSTIAVATIAIVLTWTASTDPDDASNVLTYNVYRAGIRVATGVAGLTWTDTQAPDGAAHNYTVTAVDPAGNEGPASPATTVTWSAPTSGSSGGSYPVYVCIDPPSINTPLSFKQNTVGVPLIMLLQHANGAPMDLTGKLVHLRLQPIAGGALKINAPVVILLASLGIVSYTFAGTDTDTPGSYNLEFVVTNADGSAGSEIYPADSYLRLKIITSEG